MRREARQLRRRWQAAQGEWKVKHPQKSGFSRIPTSMRMKDGAITSHPARRAADLHQHCVSKYGWRNDAEKESELQLSEALNDDVAHSQDMEDFRWSWSVTIQARASLSKGWSTGRGDVSAETLQGLSSEALWAIHTMLVEHFEGQHQGPLSWAHIRLFLLPKTKHPENWDQFRGICLLNAMSKLYMAASWSR